MLCIDDILPAHLRSLLAPLSLELTVVGPGQTIPGSYWGEPEAGLIAGELFVRGDTPVHSALHEAAHFICMTPERRTVLYTDAQGTDDEESAVCYLQLCLAEALPGVTQARLMGDMDSWGYSFRLGSTRRWFKDDSQDARQSLLAWRLIDDENRFLFSVRGDGTFTAPGKGG
ncbi:MAG: hypothetical protein AAF358_19630 [Pseudomonadota bacterium]